jgi:hypothetical protein
MALKIYLDHLDPYLYMSTLSTDSNTYYRIRTLLKVVFDHAKYYRRNIPNLGQPVILATENNSAFYIYTSDKFSRK